MFNQGVKVSAKQQTLDMGFVDLKEGKGLPFIPNSFYYSAIDDSESAPVLVFTAFGPDKDHVYEVQIYCYEVDLQVGLEILNSFKLME